MSDYSLTKAEMEALIKQSHKLESLYDPNLTELLQRANSMLESHLYHFLGTEVTIDGFYVERLVEHINQVEVSRGDYYVFPVEFQIGNTYLLISRTDTRVLADFLNIPEDSALALIIEEFVIKMADFLTEQVGYWQKGIVYPRVEISNLQSQSLTEGFTHISRYNICFDSSSIELFWYVPGDRIMEKITARRYPHSKKQTSDPMQSSKQRPLDTVIVEPFAFQNIAVEKTQSAVHPIEIVNDVHIQVIAELGSTTMTLGDLLKLQVGDVISLNKAAGDPADVYIMNKNIAKAEITIVDDHLGLRILEIDSLEDHVL